ncbi:hypothetical protein [Novosphingobium sp. KA1]|uniref:hypothetical protein n=1 Tax=Novosphingobium sp. (strain KA1) TaxID=164608 RepID=UPI001A8CF3D9|nr:hypothetical protein [Novosphingobium sp. KA1]
MNSVRKISPSFLHRPLLPLFLAAGVVLAGPAYAAPRHQDPSHHPHDRAPVVIGGAVHLIGFGPIDANHGGELSFESDAVVFEAGKVSYAVPYEAVEAFSIDHSNKALMRGAKNVVAGLAPQGVGLLYKAIRPGAETLSMVYRDENGALHAAVIMLPKDAKDEALRALKDAGLTGDPSLRSQGSTTISEGTALAGASPLYDHARYVAVPGRGEAPAAPGYVGKPAVTVRFPETTTANVPAYYLAATYEATIAQLTKSDDFGEIWREGDQRAERGSLLLATSITHLKKGNAGFRGAVPVIGMIAGRTVVVADVRLTDAQGTILLSDTFKGSKRMPGESLGAASSLAQRVRDGVDDVPIFAEAAPAGGDGTPQRIAGKGR